MNFVRSALTSVSDFYKDLNPSTLSGAIDIVVVEREDGSWASSPFHVRFGKMHLLRPHEKVVSLTVNGAPSPFQMKVGEAGEAFFVVETDPGASGTAAADGAAAARGSAGEDGAAYATSPLPDPAAHLNGSAAAVEGAAHDPPPPKQPIDYMYLNGDVKPEAHGDGNGGDLTPPAPASRTLEGVVDPHIARYVRELERAESDLNHEISVNTPAQHKAAGAGAGDVGKPAPAVPDLPSRSPSRSPAPGARNFRLNPALRHLEHESAYTTPQMVPQRADTPNPLPVDGEERAEAHEDAGAAEAFPTLAQASTESLPAPAPPVVRAAAVARPGRKSMPPLPRADLLTGDIGASIAAARPPALQLQLPQHAHEHRDSTSSAAGYTWSWGALPRKDDDEEAADAERRVREVAETARSPLTPREAQRITPPADEDEDEDDDAERVPAADRTLPPPKPTVDTAAAAAAAGASPSAPSTARTTPTSSPQVLHLNRDPINWTDPSLALRSVSERVALSLCATALQSSAAPNPSVVTLFISLW